MSDPNPYSPPRASLDAEPATSLPREGPEGLGGWLILVGFGLVISPLRVVFFVLQTFAPIFLGDTWRALLDSTGATYDPALAALLVVEVAANLVILGLSIWLLVLFFSKSRRFPMRFIGLAVINLIFMIVDAVLTNIIVPGQGFDDQTGREILRTIIGLIIWGPYMFQSRRVRNTFVTP